MPFLFEIETLDDVDSLCFTQIIISEHANCAEQDQEEVYNFVLNNIPQLSFNSP